MKEKLQEDKDTIEEIKNQNRILEKDYAEKINLENKISELSFDLENIKNMKSTQHIPIAEPKILDNIDKELLKYKEFEKKIFAAEDLLKSKLVSSEDSAGLREIIISSLLHEKNSINDSIFESFLEDYYREIKRLEIQASIYVIKYNDTMKILTSDQMAVKTELERQNSQIDSLNFLYNKLLNEKIRYKIDHHLNRKKINQMIEIDKEKSQTIQDLNDRLDDLTRELSAKALEVVENIKTKKHLQWLKTWQYKEDRLEEDKAF